MLGKGVIGVRGGRIVNLIAKNKLVIEKRFGDIRRIVPITVIRRGFFYRMASLLKLKRR